MEWMDDGDSLNQSWNHASGYAVVTFDGKRYRWRIGGPGLTRDGKPCATLDEAKAACSEAVNAQWPGWTPWVPA